MKIVTVFVVLIGVVNLVLAQKFDDKLIKEFKAKTNFQAVSGDKIGGIGLSGGGLLALYHLGVLQGMLEEGFLTKNHAIPIAGASAGALAGGAVCTGTDIKEVIKLYRGEIRRCLGEPFFCANSLDSVVRATLRAVSRKLKDIKRCRNRFYTQVSIVEQDDGKKPPFCSRDAPLRSKLISFYKNRGDLINTARASAWLPNISSAKMCSLTFRGKQFQDGGFTENLPCPPGSETDGKYCVKIAVFAFAPGASIFPGIRGVESFPVPADEWDALTSNIFAVEQNFDAIFDMGKKDAKFWLKSI